VVWSFLNVKGFVKFIYL